MAAADKKAEAAAAKARGNAAFAKNDFENAAKEFSAAIDADPTDHVFFSNRSACYASLNRFDDALRDAEKCVALKADWPKGYSRLGVALFHMKRFDDAKNCYEKGLTYEPNNLQFKESLEQVNKAIADAKNPPNPMARLFGPDMWGKLQANPTTRTYLQDPAFVAQMKAMQANPQLMSQNMGRDPRLSTALGVILGIDLSGAGGPMGGAGGMPPRPGSQPDDADDDGADDMDTESGKHGKEEEIHAVPKAQRTAADGSGSGSGSASGSASPKAETPSPTASASPSASASASGSASGSGSASASSSSAAKKDEKTPAVVLNKEAEAEKTKGTAAYNAKKLDEALAHYQKAQELDPKNAGYILATTAALLELKRYDECLELCQKGVAVAEENRAGFETVSKFYLRMGNAHMSAKKFDDAIKAYNKSLIEHFSEKAKQSLKKAQEMKKKADDEAYLDKGKSLEAKERGNKLFAENKFTDAIKEYAEAIKRDPTNAALYSNRAGCYAKLMDWGRALEDCETALKIDPKFVKVYIRKGKIQHMLKQYKKALETYDAGLKLDPNAGELMEGRVATMQAIRASAASGQADPERLKEAMRDPEIRGILNDMTMQKVLKDMQENPAAAQAAMKDKDIRANIEKLIAAGVLSVG